MWAKYGVGKWAFPAFKFVLDINNYRSSKPDYLRAHLEVTGSDDSWCAETFVFENTGSGSHSEPNIDYKVEARVKEKVKVFISPYEVTTKEQKPMSGFDRDTLKLVVKTESDKKFVIPIKPG